MKKFLFNTCIVCLFSMFSLTGFTADNNAVKNNDKGSTLLTHESFIMQAYELAINSGKNGNHTFGALLVHDGKVILTAENTVNTDKNCTNHAEMNLIARAHRELPPEVISESTLYTSTAPCMVCCASMYYAGIKRIVYGVSYEGLRRLTSFEDNSIPCDKIYKQTGKVLEWIGPILEEEGLKVFRYWPKEDPGAKFFRKD